MHSLQDEWAQLDESQQRNFVDLARHYPTLTAEEKLRFRNRLEAWHRLTPAQRQAARDKYQAFSQVPEEKQEQVRKMVREQEKR